MKKTLYAGAAAAALAVLAAPAFAQSRDQIRIVGSSTVFPYTQAVAEQFAGMTGKPAPVVESTGTGGGMQIFCGGVGPTFPDITGASRAMKQSEFELCLANGVDNVTEVLLGYDGLSIAHSIDGPDIDLTKAQLFQALASEVEVDGEIVPNPYKKLERDRRLAPRRRRSRSSARRRPRAPATPSSNSSWTSAAPSFPAIAALDEDKHGRGLRAHAPGRPVHRGRRERQPDRPAPRSRPQHPRHLRLLIPL